MSEQADFVVAMASALERAAIPYMVAGSVASSAHGPPRATNDVDIVVDPTPAQLDSFLGSLENVYVSQPAANEALRRRSMFNVIDLVRGLKADLIVLKDRPFSRTEFERRIPVQFEGHNIFVASPEDVILSKLEWSKMGESERQFRDALSVAVAKWPDLDVPYLRHWGVELSVSDALEQLLNDAARLNPEP